MGDNWADNHEPSDLDRILALPMFLAALLYLLVFGFLIHTEPVDGPLKFQYSPAFRQFCLGTLIVLYLAILGETIAHKLAGSRNMRQHIWFLLFPAFRLCPRDHHDGSHAWVVGFGWHKTTPRFERYLARRFSGPMMLIALMVLPVIAIEHFYLKNRELDAIWAFGIQTATGFIWMAFVFEFVVMLTVVEKKAKYCKQNWIDIAVILLPLIAFLRAARLGRLLKLQQLSRTAKIYRMRGLAMRTWRAVVTLDVIDMLLRRDPTYRIDKLESQIIEKQLEIEHLEHELEQVRQKVALRAQLEAKEESLANKERPKMSFSYSRK